MAKVYDKIPGLGSGRGGLQVAMRTRLYRGPDHLLIVQSTGYTEEYKRVFFRDIRYVEVRHTNGQTVQAIVLMVIAMLISLLYFATVPVVAVVLLASPFVIWFVLNLVWGPTCACFVSTNVQTLQLPTPRRLKKVAQFVAFLREQTATFDTAPQVAAF
jgi:hypothetical protein